MIDAVLEGFASTRPTWGSGHGSWVHSLSHFTGKLWELEQIEWFKNLSKIAFDGALELHNFNCCERLIGDFFRNTEWDADPKDFYITSALITSCEYVGEKHLEQFKLAPFASENAFIEWNARWNLANPTRRHNFEAQEYILHLEGIAKNIKKLSDLGIDVSEFDGLAKRLLDKQLAKFEEKLSTAPTDEAPWIAERAKEGIKATKAQMEEL